MAVINRMERKQRGREKDQVVFPASEVIMNMPEGYASFIKAIKEKIATRRIKTVLSANVSMI